MQINPILRNVGVGLAAGAVGTLVMTLGQKAEMALTQRPDSKVPAQAVETLTRTHLTDGGAEQRLSTIAHFGYGTALGLGLAALDEVPDPARTLLFFAGAQATGMALLQALDLDGKPTDWDAPSAAVDVGHHVVYALAAGLAYHGAQRLLARR